MDKFKKVLIIINKYLAIWQNVMASATYGQLRSQTIVVLSKVLNMKILLGDPCHVCR